MDSFKYVGDENLIYNIDDEDDNLFNKNENQIEFKPMKNILEITLNVKEKKIEENDEKRKNNEIIKKRRWKKLFYA